TGGANALLAAPIFTPTTSGQVTDIYVYQSGTTWTDVGAPSVAVDSYAVGDALYAMSADHTSIYEANNPNASNQGWTRVVGSQSFGRVYGQGAEIFAAGKPIMCLPTGTQCTADLQCCNRACNPSIPGYPGGCN